jgi:hypothetical protein
LRSCCTSRLPRSGLLPKPLRAAVIPATVGDGQVAATCRTAHAGRAPAGRLGVALHSRNLLSRPGRQPSLASRLRCDRTYRMQSEPSRRIGGRYGTAEAATATATTTLHRSDSGGGFNVERRHCGGFPTQRCGRWPTAGHLFNAAVQRMTDCRAFVQCSGLEGALAAAGACMMSSMVLAI